MRNPSPSPVPARRVCARAASSCSAVLCSRASHRSPAVSLRGFPPIAVLVLRGAGLPSAAVLNSRPLPVRRVCPFTRPTCSPEPKPTAVVLLEFTLRIRLKTGRMFLFPPYHWIRTETAISRAWTWRDACGWFGQDFSSGFYHHQTNPQPAYYNGCST